MTTMDTQTIKPLEGAGDALRAHLARELRLQVLDGMIYLVLEDDEIVLTSDDEVTIPAGASHRWWNAGEEDAQVAVGYRHAAPRPLAVGEAPGSAGGARSVPRRRGALARTAVALAAVAALLVTAPLASAKSVSYKGKTKGGHTITFKRSGNKVSAINTLVPTVCISGSGSAPLWATAS